MFDRRLVFMSVYGKLSEDTKHFDLGGVTITVTRYGYNRIDISRYVCNIKSEKFDYKIQNETDGFVTCTSIEEAKQYINKIRQDYKSYKELAKKLSISSDFV